MRKTRCQQMMNSDIVESASLCIHLSGEIEKPTFTYVIVETTMLPIYQEEIMGLLARKKQMLW